MKNSIKAINHSAEKVPNTVEWVSPHFPNHPFQLGEGKETPLGLFWAPGSKEVKMKSTPTFPSGKSSNKLSRASFPNLPALYEDEFGGVYHWVNLKGGGLIKNDEVADIADSADNGRTAEGLVNEQWLDHYRKVSTLFLENGIRCTPDLAHIRLYSYPRYTKEKKEMRPLKRLEIARAFGCRGRVENIEDPEYVKEAINAVKHELKIKQNRLETGHNLTPTEAELLRKGTPQAYADWFIETLAENSAKMHALGWTHRQISRHNITLDARFTDLGTADNYFETTDEQEHWIDADQAGLRDIVRGVADALNMKFRIPKSKIFEYKRKNSYYRERVNYAVKRFEDTYSNALRH